jgi:hypothetical protein
MTELNQRIEIVVRRQEANFDCACDEAYKRALTIFDVNDDGRINGVSDSCQSSDTLYVVFIRHYHSGSIVGQEHVYLFEAFVSRGEN